MNSCPFIVRTVDGVRPLIPVAVEGFNSVP